MKFREKKFKTFLFFFSFFQTLLPLPFSYTPPIHSDSLIDFKKTFLQQEILRKNQYLSKKFGIDFVSAAKNSPRISDISQGILQKSVLSIPISQNQKSEMNIYDNKEISNLYNNNKYSSFPQNFLQSNAEKIKNNNQNFYYESNLRNYYTNDDFEPQYNYNPYELNSNSFNNRQYGNNFAGEPFSTKKPSNMVYYQPQNDNIQIKNQKNNNDFRFKEKNLPKNENNKPIEENKSIEEIVKEIKGEVERKMLMEITSNFSRFSDNIHNLIQQVSQISNETIKSTEIEKKFLGTASLTEKTPKK